MPRPRRRPLTEAERTGIERGWRCGAGPGQRCIRPDGEPYDGYIHLLREETAPGAKFSPENVHPETLARVGIGTAVIIRDVYGAYYERIAQTGVVRGHDFLVVWVARPEKTDESRRVRRKTDMMPWPAEDVWLPGSEPLNQEGPGK